MGHLIIIESPLTGAGLRLINLALREGHFVTLFSERASIFTQKIIHPKFDAIFQNVFCDSIIEKIEAIASQGLRLSIVTVFDRSIARAAKLAEILKVKTLPSILLERCISKVKQREILLKNGLQQAERVTVRDIDELKSVLSNLRLPLVMKPEYGYGSTGVRLCLSHEDVLSHYLNLHAMNGMNVDVLFMGKTILDEYLEGPEFAVEIFDDRCIGIVTKKVMEGHRDFIEAGYICDVKLSTILFDALSNVALSATRALSIYDGPCHVDVKLTPNGPYVIEVNPRVAGSAISNLVMEVYGFDLVKALLHKCFDQGDSVSMVSSVMLSSAVLFLHDWDLKESLLPEDFELSSHTHTCRFERQIIPSRHRIGMLSGKTRGIDNVWELLHSIRDQLVRNTSQQNHGTQGDHLETLWNLLERQPKASDCP